MKRVRFTDHGARGIRCLAPGASTLRTIAGFGVALLMASSSNAVAQSPLVAERPYLGWSSFSQQTISSGFLTQDNIKTQADALLSSGLLQHGFTYINIDAGWQKGFDTNGRPTVDTSLFPDLTGLISHIHSNGEKAGIYWRPGVDRQVYLANPQILNTSYHVRDILATPNSAGNAFAASDSTNSLSNYKIDYSKKGAQEYINSIVARFASWGVDSIRLDGVAPGSGTLSLDNQPDVMAWGKAITQSQRSIWLTISWAINQDYFNTWQQYSNARRIGADLECNGHCSTLTSWPLTSQRWSDLIGWQNYANQQIGWSDLGPLEVGNTATDGLSAVEQQSAITLWAMANAPLYVGGDLTQLDVTGLDLLTNDEVLAVDQSGFPATQLAGGMTPVWVSNLNDGSFYIALFNLNAFPSPVSVKWSALGFLDAPQVRDVWNRRNLGRYDEQFSAVVLGHGVRLLRVFSHGVAERQRSQPYAAFFGITTGKTAFIRCKACSSGHEIVNLGLGKNNAVKLDRIYAEHAGTFRMEINAATNGSSDLFYQVNDGVPTSVKVGGGSINLPSTTSVPVKLSVGYNSIQFGNPTGAAPNLDQIAMSGDGRTTPSTFAVYDAEIGSFSGTVLNSPCAYCSGNTKMSGLGMGSQNTLTFPDVTVAGPAMYDMEIDYLTKVPRLLYMTVNGGDPIPLNLTGDSEDSPTSVVLPVWLKSGKNTVQFGNPDAEAPALDKITISLPLQSTDLAVMLALQKRSGPSNRRIWTWNLSNPGPGQVEGEQLNMLSLVPVKGAPACQPQVLDTLPLNAGTISKKEARTLEIAIDFSSCPTDALFNASVVFSSDHGALVAHAILTKLSQ